MFNIQSISDRDQMRDASAILDADLRKMDFHAARISVVVGYPRSDIGKSELVARLGEQLKDNFSIIKFDGFLNTSTDRRKARDQVAFGGAHSMLSASLIVDFLRRFGDCKELLKFRPHLAKFFVLQVYERWVALGSSRELFLEIGGTFTDNEVTAYVVPGLSILKQKYSKVRLFLVTAVEYGGGGVKTRPVVNALERAQCLGLSFELIFARLPFELPVQYNWSAINDHVNENIRDAFPRIPELKALCIPFFRGDDLPDYNGFLLEHRHLIFPEES